MADDLKKFKVSWTAEAIAPDKEAAVIMAFSSLISDPEAGLFIVIDEEGNPSKVDIKDIFKMEKVHGRTH